MVTVIVALVIIMRAILIPSHPSNQPTPACRKACGCMLLLLQLLLEISKISGAAAKANTWDAMYLRPIQSQPELCFTQTFLSLDSFFKHIVFFEGDRSINWLHSAAAAPPIHNQAVNAAGR
jgi:hypothetical protein